LAGIAKSLKTKVVINGKGFAEALSEASKTAYHALSSPVEGTILTVIKDASTAACKEADDKGNLISVLETSVSAARASVVRTPSLLRVLKEAGVVDAGGMGFIPCWRGLFSTSRGNMDNRSPELIASNITPAVKPVEMTDEDEAYGFCTQFLLSGDNLDTTQLREQFRIRKSLIVVGDTATLRVHIHTLEPETITRLASAYALFLTFDIRNMDQQHKDFLLMHKEKTVKLVWPWLRLSMVTVWLTYFPVWGSRR